MTGVGSRYRGVDSRYRGFGSMYSVFVKAGLLTGGTMLGQPVASAVAEHDRQVEVAVVGCS